MHPETRERWRYRLPHWEVAGRAHFVTIRCAGSLPSEAIPRIREIHIALQTIPAASPEFAALQRKYFLLCERYLDAGHGFCPFRKDDVCEIAIVSLAELPERHGWSVSDLVLMPNHVHLLLQPSATAKPLKTALRGWKWFIANEANTLLGRRGNFWQTDWFDRWMRNDSEIERVRS